MPWQLANHDRRALITTAKLVMNPVRLKYATLGEGLSTV